MANMMMGILLLGKRYTPLKYLSVLMITAGIIICTYSSATGKIKTKETTENEEESTEVEDQFWLVVGISLLTFALFMSARMGIYQEVTYSKYGKHPKEALFYTHALPLPGFLLLAPDIIKHWDIAMSSTPILIPVFNISIPSLLLYLLGNIITQYA